MKTEMMQWWLEHFSGLDTDSCPAVDLPDQAEGGPFADVPAALPGPADAALLTAAFAYTLGKFTCQAESLFWIREGEEDLPFYAAFDENASAGAFRSAVAARLEENREHREPDGDQLAGSLGLNRDLLLCFDPAFVPDPADPWKLCLRAEENRLTLFFRQNRYLRDPMRRLAGTVARVAEQIPACGRLRDIVLAGEDDLAELAALPVHDVPASARSVTELLKRTMDRYPDHIAVVYEGETLTYAELDRMTDAVAGALAAKGVGRGSVVSTLLPRCKWMPVAALAALKTGAAYQPLDPSYPPERLNFMVKDADAAAVIADRSLRGMLGEYEGPFLFTDELETLPACPPLNREIGPDDPFILLYTSGTTGTPKGVVLTHGNLVSFIDWCVRGYSLDSEVRYATYAGFGFDASMQDTFSTLAAGGQLHILSDSVRFDLEALNRYFNENGITRAFMTTQVGRQFAQMTDCRTLKVLSMGGEKLVPFMPPRQIRIINAYGPTECTVLVTCCPITGAGRRVPIGKPVNNTRLYVADSFGRLLPIGAMGELLIAGAQVGKGYLNHPEKTAEVFIRNRYTDDPAFARVYRTGDIVRWGNDGNMEFIGRRDAQVKIRGYRVELTEVEGVIREFPGITDATVTAFANEQTGEKYIVAYVVSPGPVDLSALKDFIRGRKPPYMVPAAVMQIDAIPLNQNQKVNRKALPKPEWDGEDAEPPENEAQQKIFDCVAEAVGHRDFGIGTDIYDAGLSSVGAIRLSILLGKAFDLPVSIQELQSHPTVKALEQALSAQAPAGTWALQEDYPLTQTQNGILVESISHPDSMIYNIPLLFRLSPKIDTARLEEALKKTIAAHPYLNITVFTDAQGDFRVRRRDEAAPEVETVRTDKLPDPLIQPFDLMGGKLYRARIFITDDGNWLFIEFHHIISDGSSVCIFLQDLNDAYAGQEPERETYTGFELALDEAKLRRTERYTAAKAWFDRLLEDADRDMLPPGDVWGEPAASDTFSFPSSLDLTAVRAYLKRNGLSANAFYNAVFALVLSRFTGKREALYTTIYNGRNDSRLSRAVTMTVKTFPVFVPVDGGERTEAFAGALGRQLMNSMANDLYSFAEIAQAHGISADVLFVYQGDEFTFDTIGGEKAEMIPLPVAETQSPLRLEISEQDGRLFFSGEHRKDRFSRDFVRRFVACMEKAVREFTEKEFLRDVILTDERTLAEMDAFNETAKPWPKRDIVSMFRAAAAGYPDRPAVLFRDSTMTYRELDEITGRIAGALRARGIGRGSVVSVLIGRSAFMVTASLGVLKAGAAYQPLDPSYPADRLSFMMKDADCALLIADETLLEKVPEYSGPVLLTKDIPALPACENPAEHPAPEDLFILLYTSGSTGTPKGVMLEHGNLANFCAWYHDFYRLDETCRVAAYASYGFDACMMDLYPALTAGACVCIVEEEIRLDLVNLEKWYRRRGITHAFMTTQICRQFYTMASLSRLKYLSAGGEKLVPVEPGKTPTRLINGYGPTECTIFSTVMPVDRLYERVPIGRPLSNYKCYVADENLQRLPPLVPGELLIAGAGVGRGYLNRPDLTEKAFIRNPFSSDPACARAYRTGDIVRLLPDGTIDFLGRNDGQVKVRGFRIELSEVESAVRDFPGITDATVQAFDNENNGEKFIAAYVTGPGRIDENAVKEFVRGRKPAYMVPSVVMQMDAIPLTQNQKVNRRALPKPVLNREERPFAAPVTELQKKLCAMFSYALGIDRVGIDDNFFEMGGTSLTVAKIAVRAAALKLPVAFRDIFDYPTVEALEKYILSLTGPDRKQEGGIGTEEHPALERNRAENLSGLRTADIGDVLLTGPTGFLGVHVLKALLDRTDHKIYCLLRGGEAGPEHRLRQMLMYYFSSIFGEQFGSRIIPVEGDITHRDEILALRDLPFRTVINCAACVKHFAADDLLDRVNWHGAENLVDLCAETGRRLVHVSTVSVAGTSVHQQISHEKRMREDELFFGQTLENKYAFSKFKAEEAVLNAIEHRNLDGKIIRVGNLMARISDGEFQINSATNAFMRSLRAYAALGKISVSALDMPLEFSPVDCTASAVVALSGAENFTVFHATNSHMVQMGDVIESMNRCGIDVETVEESVFGAAFRRALDDATLSPVVSPLITYQCSDRNMEEFEIGYDNSFTTKALYRLHVKWPIINESYLDQLFATLRGFGFFDIGDAW